MRAPILASLLATALVAGPTALAQDGEDAPKYLMGDYGVRVDLPDDWYATEWADWELEAEKDDRSLKLFAWGEPVQMEPVPDDLDAWSAVYVDKVADIGGKDPEVTFSEVEALDGRHVARFELSFDFGSDLKGAMSGGTFAVKGKMFHMAVMTAAQRASLGSQALEMLVKRAEVKAEPAVFDEGAELTGAGVTTTLPAGWRAPLDVELGTVTSRARKLGVEDLSDCAVAIHPVAHAEPDFMLTCQGGLQLGVVDPLSFEDKAAELSPKLFGSLEVPPATMVTTAGGKTGFLYAPEQKGFTLRMGVVPYGAGIARTWVYGQPGQGDAFTAALTEVMSSGTYEGEHPASLGERFSYALAYNPTSPLVLGPGLLLLVLIGGVVVLVSRNKKDPYADLVD